MSLLGIVNLDQKLVNRIVDGIKDCGFHVLKEDEVVEKKLILKSLLKEQQKRQR